MRGAAFTLAEVLITLGIIGVVAALTMPTLIQNHRSQVLKGQFKKAYSTMSQAINLANNELGIGDLAKYCTIWDHSNNEFTNRLECTALIMKQFNTTGKRCVYDMNNVFNYNKSKNNAHIDIGGTPRPSYLLSDGMCVDVSTNASTLGLSVDINGNKKGPNALGHDIFVFWVDSRGMLMPIKSTGLLSDDELQDSLDKCESDNAFVDVCASSAAQKGRPCSKNSNQRGNGLGCSWFAVNDICPDDETKGYWECLPK